jgi:hypothetical protein
MRIRSHSESHLVELDDGSRWQIFPGDLDLMCIGTEVGPQPETGVSALKQLHKSTRWVPIGAVRDPALNEISSAILGA